MNPLQPNSSGLNFLFEHDLAAAQLPEPSLTCGRLPPPPRLLLGTPTAGLIGVRHRLQGAVPRQTV